MSKGENWVMIRGFPEYMVSDLGRVKSIGRDYKYGSHKDIILKTNDRRGYRGVTLFKDGKRNYKSVHRLVADAFIPNFDGLPCVNHKDENKTNNRASNLEWCTEKYNSNYGSIKYRIGKGNSKKVMQLTKEGLLIKVWDSMTTASVALNINISQISYCCKHTQFSARGYKRRKINA